MLLKLKFYLLELNEIIKLSLNGLKKVYLILFFLSILLLSIFETYVIASLVPIIDNFTSGEKIAQLTIKFNDLIGYEISPRQFMSMIYLFTISSFFLTFFLQISSVYLNRYIVENKNAAWQKRILNSYLSQDVIFFTH